MQTDTAVTPPQFLGSSGQQIAFRHTQGSQAVQGSNHAACHVVFCGGFHSSMLGVKASALAEFCKNQGWAFTRFDYRGHGESEGDAKTLTLQDWLDDTLSILDQVNEPVLLSGSSMGGWLATLAAKHRPKKVQGLLLLAAAPDFLQELIEPRLSVAQQWDLKQGHVIPIENNYDDAYPLTQALLESGKELTVLAEDVFTGKSVASHLLCPIRLLHGTADSDVPFDLSVRLLNSISHSDAQLTLLHQADHRLSDDRSLRAIEKALGELILDSHHADQSG